MVKNITIDQLDTCLIDILDEYKDSIQDEVVKVVDKSMKELVVASKTAAPKKQISSRPAGTYANHIASKVKYKTLTGYSKLWYVKSPEYRLTHLLNNGHALHQGGRWSGTAFLSKTSEVVKQQFENDMKEAIARASK